MLLRDGESENESNEGRREIDRGTEGEGGVELIELTATIFLPLFVVEVILNAAHALC